MKQCTKLYTWIVLSVKLNPRNEQFFLFPQCFLLNQKIVSPFVNIFDILSLFAAELEEPKLACEVKG